MFWRICESHVRASLEARPAFATLQLHILYRLRLLLTQATLAAIESRLQPLRQEAVSEALSGWLASVAATVQVGHMLMDSYAPIRSIRSCSIASPRACPAVDYLSAGIVWNKCQSANDNVHATAINDLAC